MGNKKKRRSLSTFAILIVVLLPVSAATWLASGQTYTDAETGGQAVVVGASLSDILMAPMGAWHDAGDVIGFVFCLGAFLSILNATGALETGIYRCPYCKTRLNPKQRRLPPHCVCPECHREL